MIDSSNRQDAIPKNGNNKPIPRRTSVLVVGAGPTGLLLASELQRRGVPCYAIDALPGPLHWDRATVVHPRSLEIFESLGLIDRFLEAGCRQRAIKLHSEGKVLGVIDLSTCGSTYGFNLGLSEEVTESILTDHLQKLGGEVNRSSRLVRLIPHPDGVLADIERNGDFYQVDAQWLVGCDGLHSPTRELSGIGFEGHDIAKPWAVFDATLQGWTESFEANFVYLEMPSLILTALPDRRWRIYLRPTSSESDLVAEATTIIRLYAPAVSCVDVENPIRFHCHTKVATKFRLGAVFLAGDAAHVCSPNEGHGMNSGLQDAFNLAWKLALVYHGTADSTLLDSYEAERRPVAKMIAQSGDVFEQVLTMTDPTDRENRDRAIKVTFTDPKTRYHAVVAEAELNIDYSQSPIVSGDANNHLGPGQRLPTTIHIQRSDGQLCRLYELVHRSGHTLLLLGSSTANEAQLVELYTALQKLASDSPLFEAVIALSTQLDLAAPIGRLKLVEADLLGARGTTLFVVRPDGYIGLRADGNYMSALQSFCKLVHSRHP